MRTDHPPRLPARFAPHRRLASGALLLALLFACSPTEDNDRPPSSGGQAGSSFTCAAACKKAVETCQIPPLDVTSCTNYCNGLPESGRNLECMRTATCAEIKSGKCVVDTQQPFTCADACKKAVETCQIPPLDVAACTNYCNGLPESGRNLECMRTATCAELKGGKCAPACTPRCQDKVCGDDGCGGSCGSCASGSTCVDGQCQSTCPVGSSPQGGNCVCDPGYIRGEDCSGCVLDPENDGCPAHASRVNGQCACNQGYMLNESGCGCVPLPRCTNLYRCAYKHMHYPDGSGVTYNELTWFDPVQAQESAHQACLVRERNGAVSTVPPDERCTFQNCALVFSESNCAGANLFTCRYKHQHFTDGTGIAYIERTGSSLTTSLQNAYDACVNYQMYGTSSDLPPQEACRLVDCRVSG
ncbi:hypothetical protein [Vitiosangium sp. GDMCC 1.1324]|uniref:hypothetical protein n=1 Tax=Vitiosangium sp. (strain GDMCC 1.1324) TaxID=2138576 RepID=UPI000D362CFC|nr:hypothetical protein [Vitiosangium sp. GDMCC 1.1324]PTL85774.1 hypothetical protein DAT35_03480 [Vitiosangium sp. GDMCC 1.1324]